ncbi:MAG: CHASE2 domain-containing protein [Comamonas sp.]
MPRSPSPTSAAPRRRGAMVRDALQLGAASDGWRCPGPAALLLGFVLLAAVSFGMLWLGDKINAQGMAVTRFMARAQAPVSAQLAYPGQARDQITVVLYDQPFLNTLGTAWPISYQEHADWLGRLVELPGPPPKALMVDITFGQERPDPSWAALKDQLCAIQRERGIPVFLAALPDAATGQLAIRPELMDASRPGSARCYTLVGVDYVPDPLDAVAWSYETHRHFDGNQWVVGKPEAPSTQPYYRSAALAMAEDVAGLQADDHPQPMALVWGHNSASAATANARHCVPGERRWSSLVPGLLRQLWEDAPAGPLCPYHRTLTFSEVAELDETALAAQVSGKYLFVGAQAAGYNDFAQSPVHGRVPGVHMHAMALDNFLTYGNDYKQSAEWSLPPPKELLLPGLAAIAAVFIVHLGWNFVRARLRRRWSRLHAGALRRWPGLALDPDAASSLRSRLTWCVLGAVTWICGITLKAIAAMALIAGFQHFSRIGMLPVVELVGMTLLAEGLGYLARLRWLLLGPEPAPAQMPAAPSPLPGDRE